MKQSVDDEIVYSIIDGNCRGVAFYYYAPIDFDNPQLLPEHAMYADGSGATKDTTPVCGSCNRGLDINYIYAEWEAYDITADMTLRNQVKLVFRHSHHTIRDYYRPRELDLDLAKLEYFKKLYLGDFIVQENNLLKIKEERPTEKTKTFDMKTVTMKQHYIMLNDLSKKKPK